MIHYDPSDPSRPSATGTQVADCYSEPHLFVEVSDLQPWRILRINQAAVRVTGARPFVSGFIGFKYSLLCRVCAWVTWHIIRINQAAVRVTSERAFVLGSGGFI